MIYILSIHRIHVVDLLLLYPSIVNTNTQTKIISMVLINYAYNNISIQNFNYN